jgi:hypothetical protein
MHHFRTATNFADINNSRKSKIYKSFSIHFVKYFLYKIIPAYFRDHSDNRCSCSYMPMFTEAVFENLHLYVGIHTDKYIHIEYSLHGNISMEINLTFIFQCKLQISDLFTAFSSF